MYTPLAHVLLMLVAQPPTIEFQFWPKKNSLHTFDI